MKTIILIISIFIIGLSSFYISIYSDSVSKERRKNNNKQ